MRSVLAGFPPLLVAVLGALALARCGESEPTLASAPEQYHRAFLEVMVPHHVSAVETASLAAQNAEIPELRELAAQIVQIQEAEIAQMEAIHLRLFGEPLEPDPDAHEALGLTAAEAGVDHLDAGAALSVADPLDLALLDHMVPHHRGAIFVTETMMLESEDQEMRRLAPRIFVAQQEEIEAMNAIRTEHYGGAVPEVVDHGAHGHVGWGGLS